jgi:hypothetical protein
LTLGKKVPYAGRDHWVFESSNLLWSFGSAVIRSHGLAPVIQLF